MDRERWRLFCCGHTLGGRSWRERGVTAILGTSISLMYSFTLSFHLPSGRPLLLGPSISLMYPFSHKPCTPHPLSRASKPPQCISISPIPPLHNSLHLHGFPYHIFHTCFQYTHHPTLSLRMPLSESSFPLHTLLTAEPYSTST